MALALLGCSAGQWEVCVQSPQSSLVSHAVMRSSIDEARPLPSVGSCASPRTVPGAGAPRRALLHPMDPHPATRCTPSAPEKNNLEEKTAQTLLATTRWLPHVDVTSNIERRTTLARGSKLVPTAEATAMQRCSCSYSRQQLRHLAAAVAMHGAPLWKAPLQGVNGSCQCCE